MDMSNEASKGFGICVGGMSAETQMVGVICTGNVSEGAWTCCCCCCC